MTNNKTKKKKRRKLLATFVAKWKQGKVGRAFIAGYNRACALGAMVSGGMAKLLLGHLVAFEVEEKEALAEMPKHLWTLPEAHRGGFTASLKRRIEEMKNRLLDEERSPTSWGERAERKSWLPIFWGTLRDAPEEEVVEGMGGSTKSVKIRYARIKAEDLDLLHRGHSAKVMSGYAQLRDLVAALIDLKEWKLLEEVQRWAREPLDREGNLREEAFRNILKRWARNLEGVVLEEEKPTKKGLLSPSRHQAVWRKIGDYLDTSGPEMACEWAELLVANCEGRGEGWIEPDMLWFAKRLNRVLAKAEYLVAFGPCWIQDPAGNPLRKSGYWNAEGRGAAAPFGGHRFKSTSPLEAIKAWKAGDVYSPPAPWGFAVALMGNMDGEFIHAPSVFGSHGAKLGGKVLRKAVRDLACARGGRSAFGKFARQGMPLANIPSYFRSGDGTYYSLSQSEEAMGFEIAEEEGMPPYFSNFLRKNEEKLRRLVRSSWEKRSEGQDWPYEWVEERIKEDIATAIAAARPHLEACFGRSSEEGEDAAFEDHEPLEGDGIW